MGIQLTVQVVEMSHSMVQAKAKVLFSLNVFYCSPRTSVPKVRISAFWGSERYISTLGPNRDIGRERI